MIENPYKVLGLESDASIDDIKKAYRQMAKKYHPDLHPNDPEIAEKMNAVNEAYDMLTNPAKYAAKRAQEEAQAEPDSCEVVKEPVFSAQQGIARPVIQEGDSPEVQKAIDYINNNDPLVAIHLLMYVPSAERNARWYYLNAVANYVQGNYAKTTEHLEKATQLEPQNQMYMELLLQLQQAAQISAKKASGFPFLPLILGAGVLGFFLSKVYMG